MEEFERIKPTAEEADFIMLRWIGLYVFARRKSGNFNYEEKDKVVNDYIDEIRKNKSEYLEKLRTSGNPNDMCEFLAIQSCAAVMPLMFWKIYKNIFLLYTEENAERLKTLLNKVDSHIQALRDYRRHTEM